MNAALTITAADLTTAPCSARDRIRTEPMRVADFLEANPRFWLTCDVYGVRPVWAMDHSLAFVDRHIDRQHRSREAKQWTYCGNKLAALKQLRSGMAEFG